MRDAYAARYGKASDDIHGVLIDWGRQIKKRFDIDNLHLTARKGHGELAQVVESLKSLHEINSQQHALLVSMSARILNLESQLRGMPVPQPVPQQPSPPPPPPPPLQMPTQPAQPQQPQPPPPTQPPLTTPVRPAPANTPHLKAPGRGLSGGPGAKYSLAVKGSRFFLDCLNNNGQVPDGLDDKRKSDAAKVRS